MSKIFTEEDVKTLILAATRITIKALSGTTNLEREKFKDCAPYQEYSLLRSITGVTKTQFEAVLEEKKAKQAGSILGQLIHKISDEHVKSVEICISDLITKKQESKPTLSGEYKLLDEAFTK